jgi:hypothetical protein
VKQRYSRATIVVAILASLALASPHASAKVSVQDEVTALVSRAARLANDNFESIRIGRGNRGAANVTYDVESMKSPEVGYCVLADSQDDSTLFCHLRQHGSLKATTAFYLPAIQRGIPSSYKAISCPAGASPFSNPCKAWSTDGPRHTMVMALVGQGDGGGYMVFLDFRNKH